MLQRVTMSGHYQIQLLGKNLGSPEEASNVIIFFSAIGTIEIT